MHWKFGKKNPSLLSKIWKKVEFTAQEAGEAKLILLWLLFGSRISPRILPKGSEPSPAHRTLYVILRMFWNLLKGRGFWIVKPVVTGTASPHSPPMYGPVSHTQSKLL